MYLGSPRMAEMVIGEKVTLEEMGGARMHARVSGCGDVLVKTERRRIDAGARATSRYMPPSCGERAAARRRAAAEAPARARGDRPGRREQAVRHARR